MKQTQNQFFGKSRDMLKLPEGSTFLDVDTGKIHYSLGDSSPGISANQLVTNSDNDQTDGILIDIRKESTGSGYLSRVNGIRTYVSSKGTGGLAHSANGLKTYVKHTGGDIAFVNGSYNETSNDGAGTNIALYGDYHKVSTTGIGTQEIEYMIGSTLAVYLSNPNASIDRLGALNAQLNFTQPTVINTEAYVALLDIDMDTDNTGVTVDGDFAFLYIKQQSADGSGIPTVTGTARAINCQSTLPSQFNGTLRAKTLSTTGYTVGTLPAGVIGDRSYVTDATIPTYLGALTGGGAVNCPVFYNGSAWVSA